MPHDAMKEIIESPETPITAAQNEDAPQIPVDMHPALGQLHLKATADGAPAVGMYAGIRDRDAGVKIRLVVALGSKLLLWAALSYYDWPSPFLSASALSFLYMIVFA
ncbi:hypothetical protein FIBSPDRAFT_953882 [Athelia psychrophila]|uniref:Uncharacterized protein n=1 Tax=Athelia psychrophila TaxID=1759441 RepID=A0A166JRV2_9AGAM|nr:hypothetical protein FIBSPDRAFT_953882 [Fibularhizoctonia sp. CBS 109695]